MIGGWGYSLSNCPQWIALDLTDDKSTLVQVMAWCRQATSLYLSQCWSKPVSSYDVPRPQWVNGYQSDMIHSLTVSQTAAGTWRHVFNWQYTKTKYIQLMFFIHWLFSQCGLVLLTKLALNCNPISYIWLLIGWKHRWQPIRSHLS